VTVNLIGTPGAQSARGALPVAPLVVPVAWMAYATVTLRLRVVHTV
jgi:hypothetical protein